MSAAPFPLHWIPLSPLVGAALILLFGRKLSRGAVQVTACGAVLASLLVGLVAIFSRLYPLWQAARPEGASIPALQSSLADWISVGGLSLKLGLLLDPLSAVMVLVVTFVGLLIHIYSTGYMHHEPDYARFFGYLNLFTGAMLLLVLGDNLALVFLGWEGVGLCSYLLIGFWYDKSGAEQPGDANATAGRKAFIVNRVGDFGFMLGMLLLFAVAQTLHIGELSARAPMLLAGWRPLGLGVVSIAGAASLLLFVGAVGKSAQIPLYVWLPDAMAGPTPVSALIHAATMVTAGVYLVARMSFLFALSPAVMGLIALIGGLTALYAATIALAQNDLKKVLAYSTISQLGTMFIGVGVGAYSSGVFHLFTHAFFKACLFLGAGSIIHALGGEQDIRRMGGLRQRMPLTHFTFLVSCLAMAGIAPLSGFFSKDEILWRALASANPSWPSWFSALIYGLGLAAAFCTTLYLFRLYYLVFSGQPRGVARAHESPVSMTMPLLVLAFGAAVAGLCGLPGDSPLSHGFEEWLAPVTHRATLAAQLLRTGALGENALAQSHGLEWTLMGVALALAIVSILLARRLYHGGRSPLLEKLTAVRPLPMLSRAAAGAYGVDTLYRWVVVRPVQIAARALWKAVDDFVIDLLAVRLIGAWLIDWAGRISRQLHNGSVQRYFAAMVTGLAVIVIWVSWTPSVSFEIDPGPSVRAGQVVTFSPRQPAEEAARGLEYQWDFGDQSPPSAWGPPQIVTHVYRIKSSYTVRLRVRDARWKTSASETRRVEVD